MILVHVKANDLRAFKNAAECFSIVKKPKSCDVNKISEFMFIDYRRCNISHLIFTMYAQWIYSITDRRWIKNNTNEKMDDGKLYGYMLKATIL